MSSDAIVRPHGLLGGLLGGVLKLVVDVVGGLVNVLLPNGADTSGPAVAPAVLRQTLGVDNTSWTGNGVGVAVIDSGLEMSAEFQNRVKAFYDFTNGRSASVAAFDDYGHGTHVAGTIGGSGALSYNYTYHGLAPKVKFVILKVLDSTGAGYTSDVSRAVDFAVANRATLGIDIINLSLGHPIYEPAATDPLVQAIERATEAGVIVVAAAGNAGKNPTTGLPGYGGITSPGNAPSAITVGADKTQNTVTRGDDRIADYSSSGPTCGDVCQTGCRFAGPQHRLGCREARHSLQDVSSIAGSGRRLHAPERHQHGDCRHHRFDCASGRGEPIGKLLSRASFAHAERGESHPAVHGARDPRRRRPGV